MKLAGIKTSKISKNGKLIAVTYETDEGAVEHVTNTVALGLIVQELSSLIWQANKLDESNVRPVVAPTRIQVEPTKNRDGILMRFQMPNKLEHVFAISSDGAERFREQLGQALAVK